MSKTSNSILLIALASVLALGIVSCGTIRDDRVDTTPEARGPYQVSTEFAVVTPTSIDLPQGWWNPIDEKQLELLDYSLIGIRMWGNCVWYFDDPSPRTENAVRESLSKVIDSPVAEQIGIIDTADIEAVCAESASVANFPVEVTHGKRAALASDIMVDLIDSCVSFYELPTAPLAYRIATMFIDMLWTLELDTPRWPRRDFWGVREWCDNVVDGAVAS